MPPIQGLDYLPQYPTPGEPGAGSYRSVAPSGTFPSFSPPFLDDLEEFFYGLAESIPRQSAVRKYDDLYGLLDDVEAEIGWACTVDGLAAMIGKFAEYRNGEGPDPLDDGDTHWAFAILEPATGRHIRCETTTKETRNE